MSQKRDKQERFSVGPFNMLNVSILVFILFVLSVVLVPRFVGGIERISPNPGGRVVETLAPAPVVSEGDGIVALSPTTPTPAPAPTPDGEGDLPPALIDPTPRREHLPNRDVAQAWIEAAFDWKPTDGAPVDAALARANAEYLDPAAVFNAELHPVRATAEAAMSREFTHALTWEDVTYLPVTERGSGLVDLTFRVDFDAPEGQDFCIAPLHGQASFVVEGTAITSARLWGMWHDISACLAPSAAHYQGLGR